MVTAAIVPAVVDGVVGMAVGGVQAAAEATGQGSGFSPVAPALILLLPLIGFAINGLGAYLWRDNRTIPTIVGPLAVAGSFVVVVLNFLAMQGTGLHDPAIVSYWTWLAAGGLEVGVDLQFDQLSVLMTLIVTGVSTVIHVYSVGYMREDPGYSRYFSYLNLFVFFMLVLVTAANFPLMFVGWEGVGLCSYLLIGFWYENREYSDAGKKAFVVNRIGDFGFLVAMFMLFAAFGTLDFVPIFEAAGSELAHGGVVVTLITLFLFLACTGKSAQIPLYVWLPDAMAGPTPVSALIHAATMVTAGVYLVARAGVLFALAPVTQAVVAAVGAGTALFAATIATQQDDIKKVLAYSTVSQLGYMFLAVGIGAFTAGIFHLMTHAFFKALLFLGAGAVIHAMHHAFHETGRHADPNDMRNHGGLGRKMPITGATMWIATLAIAGIFPFAGFFSKDEIIWYAGTMGDPVLWGVGLVTALLTAGYMTRLMVMTFHGDNRTGEAEEAHLHEVPAAMWAPLVVLAALSVVGGWINIPEALPLPHFEALHHWLEPVFAPALAVAAEHGPAAAATAPPGGGEAVWAGVSTVLALLTVVGVFLFLRDRDYLTADEAPAPTGLSRVLARKWYVDELYDRLVVRPSLALWRACWKIVDDGVIDRAVNGLGSASRAAGWVGSQVQTGRIGTYIVVFVAGALVILGTFAF
jgi:NADH-quinone oxidoreductase subunit L